MAESENVYVKIGERGRFIERTATSPRDHVNLKATGWVLKGSKGAPTEKDATAKPLSKKANAALTNSVPTSVKAFADAAEVTPDPKSAARSTGRGSSRVAATADSGTDAGEAADAKSQAAAGR